MTVCIHKAHFERYCSFFFLFVHLFLHFSPLKGSGKTARETFSGEENLNKQTLGIAHETTRVHGSMAS